MRKMLLAVFTMFLMAGLVIAVEVTVKEGYKAGDKEITVKEGDKEITLKISDKAKFTTTDKDGKATESTREAFDKRASGKSKTGVKLDIKHDGKELTEASWKGGKK